MTDEHSGLIGNGRLGATTLCDHSEANGHACSDRLLSLIVFVCNQQHYQNVSAHCNSGRPQL